MRDWLLDDLRLDADLLGELSLAEIEQYMQARYKRRELGTLKAAIKALQEETS